MLSGKEEAFASWCNLKNLIENDTYPSKVAIIHSDAEPLYHSPKWIAHARNCGIEHEFSSRHRHDQNNVIE